MDLELDLQDITYVKKKYSNHKLQNSHTSMSVRVPLTMCVCLRVHVQRVGGETDSRRNDIMIQKFSRIKINFMIIASI